MENTLQRTKVALEQCEDHIESHKDADLAIEAYLTDYILFVLCSDMQHDITRIVVARAEEIGDGELAKFVEDSTGKILRSVKKSEIAGFLKSFGEACKNRLNTLIDDDEVTFYNSAVDARHAIAHTRVELRYTFRDLKRVIEIAESILSAVDESIRAPWVES